jgi:hypothetical protein
MSAIATAFHSLDPHLQRLLGHSQLADLTEEFVSPPALHPFGFVGIRHLDRVPLVDELNRFPLHAAGLYFMRSIQLMHFTKRWAEVPAVTGEIVRVTELGHKSPPVLTYE